jgi:cysteine-rich repeat protein
VSGGLDLDAVHYTDLDGHLYLSFDGSGNVGGVDFDDEDVLEYDPGGGVWALLYDGSARHSGWPPADLDALGVAICGDSIVDPGEECDDANETIGDGCESDCTLTPFDLLFGKRLVVRDNLNAEKRKLVAVSNDPAIQTPAAGSAGDPRIGGGTLRLVNPTLGEDISFSLPGSGWVPLGLNPEAKRGWKYEEADFPNQPCKVVVVKPGQVLRARCLKDQMPFTLDETSQGSLTVTLRLGTDTFYCLAFGGTVVRDFGLGTKPSQIKGGLFKARDSSAIDCPLP